TDLRVLGCEVFVGFLQCRVMDPPVFAPFPYTTLFRSWALARLRLRRRRALRSSRHGLPANHSERSKPRTWRRRMIGRQAVSRRRSEEHTSELQSLAYLVCRLLLVKKNETWVMARSALT